MPMLEYTCKQCGKTFFKRRRGHQFKYCSSGCYNESRQNHKCLEAVKLCQSGLSQAEAALKAGTTKAAFHCWLHSQGDGYIAKIFEDRICQHCGTSLAGMPGISNRKYCSKYCCDKAQSAKKRKPSSVRPSRELTKITCMHCGKTVEKTNNGNAYKYCSCNCYNESKRQYHKYFEAVELCRSGLNKEEAAKKVGVKPHTFRSWLRKRGDEANSKIFEDRKCQHCGKSLAGMLYSSSRKYCSHDCFIKAQAAKLCYTCLHCGTDFSPKHRLSQYQRQHQEPKFCSRSCYYESRKNEKCLEAVKLYQSGMAQIEAAKQAGFKTHILYQWLSRNPENKITTVSQRLAVAKTPIEWTQVLRQNAPEGDASPVHLVCQPLNGRATGDYFGSFVLDALKQDPRNGETYAFCSLTHEVISTVLWHNGALCCFKLPKSRGEYIWPHPNFGLQVEIQRNEFEYLLTLPKEFCKK